MPGISDLVNNITGSVNGLIADLKGESNNVVEYHQNESEYKAFQSQLNAASWMKLSFPYTFSIVNLEDPSDDFTSGFSDFKLPLAPQSINQREAPAITMKASQGGTTTNHNGMGYKILSIAGTTGIAPFRGDGGVNRKTGEAIFQPKDLKHKSGYEVFIHLRNWFRTYYEWKKKNGADARNFRLVFKNYKDGEFLIVELESFEMDRQAAKSFLYDYKMEFKVLSHFEFSTPESKLGFLDKADAFLDDALDKINTARGVFLRTQGILRQIESTYNASVLEPLRSATLAIKAALAIPVVAADIGSRTIVNTVSTAKALAITARELLNTVTLGLTGKSQTLAEIGGLLDKRFGSKGTLQKTFAATQANINQNGSAGLLTLGALMMRVDAGQFPEKTLSETAKEQAQAAELPRNFYEDAIESLERVKKNAEDFFNLGSADYDAIFDRTATLNADVSKVTTNDEYDILFAFNEAITGLNLLLSTTAMFKSSMDAQINDMNARFNGQLQLSSKQAVRQVRLKAGQSLERLAQKELGDSTRWGEIVEINGLKAPYVSDDPQESRDGVLKAGSTILIPASIINGFSQTPQGRENKLTKGMSPLEKNLGVDFKIDKDFDLVLSSSGDFELVAGGDNMSQGTILKLSYEPGDVMLYPTLGAGISVGRKFPPLEDITDRLTTSLLQDARISKVTDIAITRDGPALYLQFNIFIKNIDIPVPVKIKV
jgi:hypothetical protein